MFPRREAPFENIGLHLTRHSPGASPRERIMYSDVLRKPKRADNAFRCSPRRLSPIVENSSAQPLFHRHNVYIWKGAIFMNSVLNRSVINLKEINAGVPLILPCDFMIRREPGSFTPVVFFNNGLPDILLCISKELSCLRRELLLRRKLHGRITPPVSGPLEDWYQSILGNIYPDYSERFVSQRRGLLPQPSFYMEGEIYMPAQSSIFLYVTLFLPPLWQNIRDADVFANKSRKCGRFARANHMKRSFFCFYYCPDTLRWYVSLSYGEDMRKNIAGKSEAAVPACGYPI